MAAEYLSIQAVPVGHNVGSYTVRNLRLRTLHGDRIGPLNESVRAARDRVRDAIAAAADAAGLLPTAATAAESIVVWGLVADAYRHVRRPVLLAREMLDLLQRGRVICGWSNTDETLNTGVPVYW